MTTYTLTLQIDSQSVSSLRAAGLRVTLGRSADTGTPRLIWIAFDPTETATVAWDDSCGLFASTSVLQRGTTLALTATVPAPQDASIYPLLSSLSFGSPASGNIPSGYYAIQNEAQVQPLASGLTQSATVNQTRLPGKAIFAVDLSPNLLIAYSPQPTVYVWLQSDYGSGTYIEDLLELNTRVIFDDAVTTQTLTYDALGGRFVPVPATQAENVSTLPA